MASDESHELQSISVGATDPEPSRVSMLAKKIVLEGVDVDTVSLLRICIMELMVIKNYNSVDTQLKQTYIDIRPMTPKHISPEKYRLSVFQTRVFVWNTHVFPTLFCFLTNQRLDCAHKTTCYAMRPETFFVFYHNIYICMLLLTIYI